MCHVLWAVRHKAILFSVKKVVFQESRRVQATLAEILGISSIHMTRGSEDACVNVSGVAEGRRSAFCRASIESWDAGGCCLQFSMSSLALCGFRYLHSHCGIVHERCTQTRELLD